MVKDGIGQTYKTGIHMNTKFNKRAESFISPVVVLEDKPRVSE
jgi:hypothetical protein